MILHSMNCTYRHDKSDPVNRFVGRYKCFFFPPRRRRPMVLEKVVYCSSQAGFMRLINEWNRLASLRSARPEYLYVATS